MLELKNVTKEIYTKHYKQMILVDINMTIEQGEFITIVGPSGSGKTTLLNILSLLDDFSFGDYYIDGKSTEIIKNKQKAIIRNNQFGYVLQNFALLPDYTVYENVEYPLKIAKIPAKKRKEQVLSMLDKLGISQHRNKMPAELSGGQQQRVAIGRALINNPKVVFADEPTGALDSENSEIVLGLIKEINATGTTIVLVTHDMQIAKDAKRQITVFDGKIIADTKEL